MSEGDYWVRQRRIAQPAFHRERIASFAALMYRATSEMLEAWGSNGATVDIGAEMTHLTFRIVSEALFSAQIREQAEAMSWALTVVLEDAQQRVNALVELPLWLPTQHNRRVRRAIETMRGIAAKVIDKHRHRPEGYQDLLAMLLEARDEQSGEQMSDAQLVDEIITILIAGHETTATVLTWAFYLLSQNPEEAAKLRQELNSVLNGRPPGLEDLGKLTQTEQIVKETMRLYPPVWWLNRMVMQDEEIGGYAIRRDSAVVLSPYLMHHHPDYWEDPESFRPSRFSPENVSRQHPFAYLPFSHGPRQCIGNNFAMMEAKLILATVAQRYHLSLVPGLTVEMGPAVVLRPREPVRLRLETP